MLCKFITLAAALSGTANAARPFINEPDTGLGDVTSGLAVGALPNIKEMVTLHDFDYAARNYLPTKNYTYYRNGAGGEWSYRNNLEVYNRYRLKPRQLFDITGVEASLNTTILGNNFSNPFFISPAAKAMYGNPDGELGLVKGAAAVGKTLYIVSGYSSLPFATIAAAAAEDQVLWSQMYISNNQTANEALIDASVNAGAQALVLSVDSPGSPSRARAARYDVGSANANFVKETWEVYAELQAYSKVPIVLKGIQNVLDARKAVDAGVRCIILSNHGGRNLDGSPSSLEIALEIYQNDPSIFTEIEVLADGGVRYGTDALRLLALGVKAVGMGRPIMYSNVYGEEGVAKAISILRTEIMNDAANLGVADLKAINADYVDWTPNSWFS